MAMPGRGGAPRFDSLVQTQPVSTRRGATPPVSRGPKELPAQMLDHATGLPDGVRAMNGTRAPSRGEGGSWHVRVSLARPDEWLWNAKAASPMD